MYRFSVFIIALLVLMSNLVFGATSFKLDVAHTNIGFSVRHMVITNVKGKFNDFTGEIKFDENDLENSSIDVAIQVKSIDTDNQRRDDHLRSSDFFSADEFPQITFKSTKIEKTDNGYVATGNLTMRGVTKEIKLPFEVLGKIKDQRGNTRIGIEGSTTVNRQEYGISWNKTLDSGGLVVSDEVKIELDAQLIQE